MPTYDYLCESNGRVVEVKHRMNEQIANWGELCERARLSPGDIPLESPVKRLATGGNLISSSSLGNEPEPTCSTGTCCPGGVCGLN